jgi:Leucine-rich repeat (LRR) protein
LSNLKRLDLDGCGELGSLPPSIGGLTKLTFLNISGSGVEELPEILGELQSLESFHASGCSSLSRLPESFGLLSNLETLNLDDCGVL